MLPGRSVRMTVPRHTTSAALCFVISLGSTNLISMGAPGSAESSLRNSIPEQLMFVVTPLRHSLSRFTR